MKVVAGVLKNLTIFKILAKKALNNYEFIVSFFLLATIYFSDRIRDVSPNRAIGISESFPYLQIDPVIGV